MNRINILLTIFVLVTTGLAFGQEYHWYKGNTHAHTTNSDGNELPRRVVAWYLDHGYNFLVITDHDYITETKYLDTDWNDDFILIPGEEISDRAEKKPVHLNAIGINKHVNQQHGNTIIETLQNNIDAINAAGGIAQINHPNWHYAFNDSALSRVKNCPLVEIYNIPKESNNYTAGGVPGMEEIWDRTLTNGNLIYGVFSDDTHDYIGEFSSEKSYPGRGWVMVRSTELTPKAIVEALGKGDFYATDGIILSDVKVNSKEYTVEIRPVGDAKYSTIFIGKGGKILREDYSLKSTYQFKGDEGYVRVKIFSSTGDIAITQPLFINR
jgi:hypothetical protein